MNILVPGNGSVARAGVGRDEPLAIDLRVVLCLAGGEAQVLARLRAGHLVAVDGHVLPAHHNLLLPVNLHLHAIYRE